MKKILLLLLFVVCCCSYSAEPHVYVCRKCDMSTVKKGRPNVIRCPAQGSHIWLDLGKFGKNIYHCFNCICLKLLMSKL